MTDNQIKSGEESDSDKENESNRPMISCNGHHVNGSFEDMAIGFKHKRLSSDTFPDRKVVAVIANESHKSDESLANNTDYYGKSVNACDESPAITSKCRKSPPTPSKKFFLSVDSSHTRSRSLSLDRKSQTTSSSTASTNESVEHSVVMQFESMSFSRSSTSYVLSEEINVEERIGFVY